MGVLEGCSVGVTGAGRGLGRAIVGERATLAFVGTKIQIAEIESWPPETIADLLWRAAPTCGLATALTEQGARG